MIILSFLALAMTASAQIDKGDDGFGQKTITQNAVKKVDFNAWCSVTTSDGTSRRCNAELKPF